MSARGGMIHRATIQRDRAVGEDGWGNTTEPDWQDHLADLPCKVWFTTGREVTDAQKIAVIDDRRMICPKTADVTEADRVLRVTDRKGTVIFDGPARIESVGQRADHLALVLEAI